MGLTSREIDLTAVEAGRRLAGLLQDSDALVFGSAITREHGRDCATLMRNLAMGQAVTDALELRPCAHVVYLSSDAVYGDAPPCPLTEATPCEPVDLYGVMHLTRERMLTDTAQRLVLPLLVLRPTIVYGAGDTHASYGPNRFMREIRSHRRIRLFGDGEERRDHIHVDDVAETIALGLAGGTEGVLNVATGVAVRFAEIAALMRQAAGGDVPIESVPRQQPAVDRWFDVTGLSRAFPGFSPRSLTAGLDSLVGPESSGNGVSR